MRGAGAGATAGAVAAFALVTGVLLTAPGRAPEPVPSGSSSVAAAPTVSSGKAGGAALAVEELSELSGLPGRTTAEVPTPRPVHAVMLAPPGLVADPEVSPQVVRDVVQGASEWWESQTGGRIAFEAVEVLPWQTTDASCTDIGALWEHGLELMPEAAEPGHHLLVVIPQESFDAGCQYGFGSMGVLDSGGSVMVSDMVPSLVAHELGHNLGLGHSHALWCEGAADGRWDSRLGGWRDCTLLPYDDLFGVMGYSGRGFGETSLNAVHLDQLGIEPDAVRDLTAEALRSGTPVPVTLPPLSAGGAGRAVKVSEPGGPDYYLEYRTESGADAAYDVSGWSPELGLRVLRTDPEYRDATGSIELDASPEDDSDYQRALPVGGEFTSDRGRVRVRLVSADEAGAQVEVSVTRR